MGLLTKAPHSQVDWIRLLSRLAYEQLIWFMASSLEASAHSCSGAGVFLSFSTPWAVPCTSKCSFWIKLPVSLYCLQTKKSKFYGTWVSEGNMILKKGHWTRSQKTFTFNLVLILTAMIYLFLVALSTWWRVSTQNADLLGVFKTPYTLISHADSIKSLSFPLGPPTHCLTIKKFSPGSLHSSRSALYHRVCWLEK